MRDRQVFETHRLPNGITMHHYPTEQPFAQVQVVIPFGAAHCAQDIIPGTAHFFEHAVMLRSKRYPEKNSFSNWIGRRGGYFNAHTSHFETTFVMHIPADHADEAWHGLQSQIFEPLFEPEDLANERAIVSNERGLQRWYPGHSELSHHLWTSWMNASGVSKRQMFGSEEDLKRLSVEALAETHRYYFHSGLQVLVGGNVTIEPILETLASLPTKSHSLEEQHTPFAWEQREYNERSFADLDAPSYFIGTHYPLPAYEERVAIHFLLEALTNIYRGALYTWLRDEKGWVYEINAEHFSHGRDEATYIEMPLHSVEQIGLVRQELDERIQHRIADTAFLEEEVERQLSAEVFDFQTLEEILEAAARDLSLYGKVVSEAERGRYKRLCRDSDYIEAVYKKHLSPSVRGEFCALPK